MTGDQGVEWLHGWWREAGRLLEASAGTARCPEFRHPFSGAARPLSLTCGFTDLAKAVATSSPGQGATFSGAERRLMDLGGADARWLPADPALPCFPVFEQTDIEHRKARRGADDEVLLSVVLGPVQSFIAAARSLRDLWTGSAILSWLTFRAMGPVIEAHGVDAFVFPVLRGHPLLEGTIGDSATGERVIGLPNRFLASVPASAEGGAQRLARDCEAAARQALEGLAEQVRRGIDRHLAKDWPAWDGRWAEQIATFLSVRAVATPMTALPEELGSLLYPAQGTRPAYSEATKAAAESVPTLREAVDSNWAAWMELSGRMSEAVRSVAPVPAPALAGDPPYPPKCSLLGSLEQMGPGALDRSADFWEVLRARVKPGGVRVRAGERFCAPSLVKRFAVPLGLAKELGLDHEDTRFPDTATVAASDWLAAEPPLNWRELARDSGRPWSGQWLHAGGEGGDPDPDEAPPPEIGEAIRSKIRDRRSGPPPTYYAVLLCDGDAMGDWLSGVGAPALDSLVEDAQARGIGQEPMPVGPAWHATISSTLSAFARHIGPRIVAGCSGTLVYAGGDDLLAVLPARRALDAGWRLRQAFRGVAGPDNHSPWEGWFRFQGEDRDHLTLGPRASLSAGIAIAHIKQDLREVLDTARSAEKAAKSAGRNAVGISFMRRSGEHAMAVAAWDDVAWMEDLMGAFDRGASDRWAYRLRALEPTLSHLPDGALLAEIKRQVNRSEGPTRTALGADGTVTAGEKVAGLFGSYRARRAAVGGPSDRLLRDFLVLCQGASFLTRARDT